MNPYAALAAVGASLLCAVIAAGAGYHFGELASKTAWEAQHAAQLQAAVNRLDENAREAAADHAHLQGVIDRYAATPIDPIVPGAAHRVYLYSAGACGHRVPEAPAVAGNVPDPAAVPIGPSEVERRLDAYIRACDADARRLSAVQALAPQLTH